MMFRVSGKLTEGRTFSLRIDADSVTAAVETCRKQLTEKGVKPAEVLELHAGPLAASTDGVYIGQARKGGPRKGKKAAAK